MWPIEVPKLAIMIIQAVDYVNSFRKVANQLRNQTCGVSMVWAPNAALGYPWRGSSQAQP